MTAIIHTVNRAVVLVSGGLDSVAALVWARARYSDLRAISFDYGQPNRSQELPIAQEAAGLLGVAWSGVHLGDAMRPAKPAGIMGKVEDHDASKFGGIDRAFVPGRNLVFLTVAVAHAATWFSTGSFDVIIGACSEDQAGFPDCQPTTLAKLAMACNAGSGKSLRILSPWADKTKAQILYAIEPDPDALDLVSRSYSCYRPDGPCGACSACVKRAAAFEARGLTDYSKPRKMFGGDAARELR